MEKQFNILFLSNMMKEKGIWTLLEACKILKEREYRFECHFVGKWSDVNEEVFAAYVDENGLGENVYAHGPQYGEDKEIFWNSADLFVFPTFYHNECFPLVLLEAMQHSIACISTNEGGIPEIIDEQVTGYLVEKQNTIALADKMAYLIEHRAQCQSMGCKGREKLEREFSLQRFEERMLSILRFCQI